MGTGQEHQASEEAVQRQTSVTDPPAPPLAGLTLSEFIQWPPNRPGQLLKDHLNLPVPRSRQMYFSNQSKDRAGDSWTSTRPLEPSLQWDIYRSTHGPSVPGPTFPCLAFPG